MRVYYHCRYTLLLFENYIDSAIENACGCDTDAILAKHCYDHIGVLGTDGYMSRGYSQKSVFTVTRNLRDSMSENTQQCFKRLEILSLKTLNICWRYHGHTTVAETVINIESVGE